MSILVDAIGREMFTLLKNWELSRSGFAVNQPCGVFFTSANVDVNVCEAEEAGQVSRFFTDAAGNAARQ